MKLFLSILVYGTLFFTCLIPLALAMDIWECWKMRKNKAGNNQEPSIKPSVAHDIKHNDLLQRIMDARPESPEELYEDLDKSKVHKDKN